MLVLTRKYQEKIRIGDNITITILRMKGKAVRLGIEAPAEVPVVRAELSFEDASSDANQSLTLTLDGDSPVTTASRSGRLVAGIAGMPTAWATDSHPTAIKGEAKSDSVKVGFGRIGRDDVSKLMPKLLSGTAPLRAMMDQRG